MIYTILAHHHNVRLKNLIMADNEKKAAHKSAAFTIIANIYNQQRKSRYRKKM